MAGEENELKKLDFVSLCLEEYFEQNSMELELKRLKYSREQLLKEVMEKRKQLFQESVLREFMMEYWIRVLEGTIIQEEIGRL